MGGGGSEKVGSGRNRGNYTTGLKGGYKTKKARLILQSEGSYVRP